MKPILQVVNCWVELAIIGQLIQRSSLPDYHFVHINGTYTKVIINGIRSRPDLGRGLCTIDLLILGWPFLDNNQLFLDSIQVTKEVFCTSEPDIDSQSSFIMRDISRVFECLYLQGKFLNPSESGKFQGFIAVDQEELIPLTYYDTGVDSGSSRYLQVPFDETLATEMLRQHKTNCNIIQL
jgi:hypothetical protein